MHDSALIRWWIGITLAASVFAIIDGGWLATTLALAPERVWHGEVWRLVTWALVETSPLRLVLLCVTIFVLGGELVTMWGDRRMRRFMLQIVIAAGVVGCVAALLSENAWWMRHTAGWAIDDAIVIAWARQFPQRPLRIYGLLELRGQQLVTVTLVVTAVFAAFNGPFVMAPELAACAAAALYPRGWLR
jgi:membrane associated rhomboid family serine protease